MTPALVGALRRAEAAASEIAAARLVDGRLEAQRERTVPALSSVLTAMHDVTRAAHAGDVRAAVSAAGRLRAALTALRTSGSASS